SRILEKETNNLSENGKEYLDRVQCTAMQMQVLIQDLLAYSGIDLKERKFENIELNQILVKVKESLKEELLDKHATLTAITLNKLNIIPFQFHQLLHNLISNALKYSKPTHPPNIIIKSKIANGITFKNTQLSPQQLYCHISVSDNGIGFDPKYNEKIFELFYRLHAEIKYKGTGIGLAIVKKIVENHGGIITANSELNIGTTFDIYIPAT
ncbi:MAG: histidine kinase, partial [Saprospiraceae bacterium]|nr:histidine kinase [Saprospiraceae bacterium]